MPILITDHSWSQDATHVCLSVPLHGISVSKADVLHTEKYVKISFAPFLFEVLLYDQIDPIVADIKFEPKRMFATFTKAQPNHEWPQLNDERQQDRDYMRQVRREAVERYLQIVDERDSKTSLDKHNEHLDCVHEQMALDGSERGRIKAVKSQVINDLERELEAWKRGGSEEELIDSARRRAKTTTARSAHSTASKSSVHISHPDSTDEEDEVDEVACGKPTEDDDDNNTASLAERELNEVLHQSMQFEDDILVQSQQNKINGGKNKKNNSNDAGDLTDHDAMGLKKHPIRTAGGIAVNFTPRVFPTPERESAREAEDEWLMKQSEARAVIDKELANLKPEERDPLWLLSKATKLETAGDFDSACEALSYAIRLSAARRHARASRLTPHDDVDDEKLAEHQQTHILPQLWLGRARCQLKRRNLHKCIEDCSTALEQYLRPACEANRDMRADAHATRGHALLQLELPQEALVELKAAYDLMKRTIGVATDAAQLRQSVSEKDGDRRSRLMQCAALLARAKDLVENGGTTQNAAAADNAKVVEEAENNNNAKLVNV